MIGIGFKNMKVFKEDQWFDFKKLTLLTGTNNSGKSSMINCLQMLQENLAHCKSLDDLLDIEIKLTNNLSKYGSLECFINNESIEKYFEFYLSSGDIKYAFKVVVLDGLQSVGKVIEVKLTCNNTNTEIFNLCVGSTEHNVEYEVRINYNYFVNDFNYTYQNTVESNNEVRRLLELVKRLNEGEFNYEELNSQVNSVEEKYRLGMFLRKKINYDNDENTYDSELWDIDFQDILMYSNAVPIFIKTFQNQEFNDINKTNFKNGIFDFSCLWIDEPYVQQKFEEIICTYYNTSYTDANRLLSKDILDLLSAITWKFSENNDFSSYNEDYQKMKLDNILDSLDSFGLVAFVAGNEEDDISYKNLKSYLYKATADLSKNYADEKAKDNFYNNCLSKLGSLIFSFYQKYNGPWAYKKKNDISLIPLPIYKKINSKIFNTILQPPFYSITFNNHFVSSNRFTNQRSFSFNDNTDFTNYLKLIENSKNKGDSFEFINTWLQNFDIAEELTLIADKDTGNIKAYLTKNNLRTLLTDYGLGTNQLLPIIFSLALKKMAYEEFHGYFFVENRTVIIEEPEANLHPALQSKLADMFIDAIEKFNVQILVETHSEYLIRKLQYLIASTKSNAKSDDVMIYYFTKANHSHVLTGEIEQVRKIEIDKFGKMNIEFGKGFFDEADNIAMELFLLQQSQSN